MKQGNCWPKMLCSHFSLLTLQARMNVSFNAMTMMIVTVTMTTRTKDRALYMLKNMSNTLHFTVKEEPKKNIISSDKLCFTKVPYSSCQ